MDLSRPPEPFHRVYSPPEAPPTGRRRPVVGAAAAATGVVMAVAVGLSVGSGTDPGNRSRSRGPDRASVGGSPNDPRAGRSAADAGAVRTFVSVPAPCSGVDARTLHRLVSAPSVHQSSNSSLATCTFSSTSGGLRRLRVETRVIPPGVTATPVQDMAAFFAAQWARARRDAAGRTVSLERYQGLGDEAYRWYRLDLGGPAAVGEVALRVRNAVVTVAYSRQEQAPAAASTESERSCLAEATEVAREVAKIFP